MSIRLRSRTAFGGLLLALAMLVPGLVVASPAHAATATFSCDDGSTSGINGYTSSSDCAKKIAHYRYNNCTVNHSDDPTGRQDTLTVSCLVMPPPLGDSRPPTGQLVECHMRATGAECSGWAEDPDNPNARLTVDFNVAGSTVYPAHRQSANNSSLGDSSIKSGYRWFWKLPIFDVYNGTDIQVVVRGVDSSGVKDGVNTTLGVRKIGPGANTGKFAKTQTVATGGTKSTGKITYGIRYNCTSTTTPRRDVPAVEWNNPLAYTSMYTKRERWCLDVSQNGVKIGRLVTEFNVRFENSFWNFTPFTRRVLVNSTNVVYWVGNTTSVPRPDNIDANLEIYAPGIALTLQAGPASLELKNGRLTGDFGTQTDNETQLTATTRGTVISYAGVATPTVGITISGRFGTDYFQSTSTVASIPT